MEKPSQDPVACILCGSNDTHVLEKLNVDQLSALYKHRAKVDVERLFVNKDLNVYQCKHCDLIFYYPQAIGDGVFYDELQHFPGYYMEEKPEFEQAAKWVSQHDDVLEIGCGSGRFSRYIKSKSYTGLEFSDNAILQARKDNLNVLKQDLKEHAAAHPDTYDVVCYFQVLEHVAAPGNFLRDSLKCIKPGGKLIIAVPCQDSFIKNAVNFYLNMPPHHASKWSVNALKNISALYGISLIDLYHEQMHRLHVRFYAKTTIYNYLRKGLKIKTKSLDPSMRNKFLYGLAVLLAFPYSLFIKKNKIIGQSMMGVYSK